MKIPSRRTFFCRVYVIVLLGVCGFVGAALPGYAQKVASLPPPAPLSAMPPPPQPAEATPSVCRVGVYITALNDFDLVKKSFQIDFWAWAISPTRPAPLKTLEVIGAREAKAQFDQVETKTDPYHNFGANRKVFWSSRKYTSVVRYDWDESNYPFDRHVLLVEMEDAKDDSSNLVFLPDADNTRIGSAVRVEGWKVTNVDFTSRKNVYNTTYGDPSLVDGKSEYSRLVLAISIEREKRTSYWKLTAGVYAAFVLSLLAFFYDSDQTSLMSARSGILVGSLFAAIVNMRASEGVLGHAEGLTLVDKIHILTIVYIFCGAAAGVVSRLISENKNHKLAVYLDRRVLAPAFLLSYISINIVLVWQASFMG